MKKLKVMKKKENYINEDIDDFMKINDIKKQMKIKYIIFFFIF